MLLRQSIQGNKWIALMKVDQGTEQTVSLNGKIVKTVV